MTPAGMRVMLAVEPVDMRRSFDGLAALVVERFGTDPRADRMMFAFVGRRRTTVKILWRDHKGWFLLARRLDQCVVALPRNIPEGARSVVVDAQVLAALLEGVEARRYETRRDVARASRAALQRQRDSTQPST